MSDLFSWAYFFPDTTWTPSSPEFAASRYDVTRITRCAGDFPVPVISSLTRVEISRRVIPTDGMPPHLYSGVTQHLLYTDSTQRADLLAGGTAPFPPAPDTVAVIIPIRKSDAWWQLPQDQRIAHFHSGGGREGHTAIGLPYVSRIFRRLYHSRYLESGAAGYDFVTYFEFKEADTSLFMELLESLRDVRKNPEWEFVDEELEIWTRKISG